MLIKMDQTGLGLIWSSVIFMTLPKRQIPEHFSHFSIHLHQQLLYLMSAVSKRHRRSTLQVLQLQTTETPVWSK